MRALSVKPGSADSLRVVDFDRPEPRNGEVLVRVLEVGIEGIDKALRTGKHGRAPSSPPPARRL